jgi:hypothetical protein
LKVIAVLETAYSNGLHAELPTLLVYGNPSTATVLRSHASMPVLMPASAWPLGGSGGPRRTVDCCSNMEETTGRFRRAERQDVPAIVRLLADDPLGSTRETADGDQLPDPTGRRSTPSTPIPTSS